MSDIFSLADDLENQRPPRTRACTGFDLLDRWPSNMPLPTPHELVTNFQPASEEVRSIDALTVSDRCSGLADPKFLSLVWMLQQRSMEPAGLERLACELVAMFPARLDAETLRYSAGDCLITQLAKHLENCCRSPRCDCYDWQISIWDGRLQDDLLSR